MWSYSRYGGRATKRETDHSGDSRRGSVSDHRIISSLDREHLFVVSSVVLTILSSGAVSDRVVEHARAMRGMSGLLLLLKVHGAGRGVGMEVVASFCVAQTVAKIM